MAFEERGEGQPQAIKAWFYPGETSGQQFVYPKRRAVELAKMENEPVLTMPETTEAPTVETLKSAPVTAVQPSGEEVASTTVVESPPAAVVAQALPHTASSLPLVGLAGLLSLCVGFALLIVTKRTA